MRSYSCEVSLKLFPPALNEFWLKAVDADNMLLWQRWVDSSRKLLRQSLTEPNKVIVASDDTELTILKVGPIRAGVNLVRDIGVDGALVLQIQEGERDTERKKDQSNRQGRQAIQEFSL